MKRALLVDYLDRGFTVAHIGRLESKESSTVSYWLKKHGLAAVNRERHAPRGGIAREALQELVDEGLTTQEIAARLDRSQGTIRHWLRRHDLATVRKRVPADSNLDRYSIRECRHHGMSRFVLEGRGYYRCTRCRAQRVVDRRRRVKRILVEEAGARCAVCGYDRCIGALEFHHLDATEKRFGVGSRGLTLGIETLRTEALKCVLLCANCHVEVEAGVTALPLELRTHRLAPTVSG